MRRTRAAATHSGPAPVQVLPPDTSRLPRARAREDLDPAQREAADGFARGRDVLVHAGPGAGRTTLALSCALEVGTGSATAGSGSADSGPAGEVVLLSPRRATADALRDAVALAGASGQVRVATPVALAFTLVRADAHARGTGDPTLVTGADQDAVLAELIAQRDREGDWALDLEAGTRTLPGFRNELRDLVTRATEWDIDPRTLAAWARERGRPAWEDGAAILAGYLDVLALQSRAALDAGDRLDSGGLVRAAARLAVDPDTRGLPRAVVVDDAQDLTAAGAGLVVALARSGAPVLLTTCPDESVDTFRGALPEAAELVTADLGRRITRIDLGDGRGPGGTVGAALGALRARLPLAGADAGSRRPPAAGAPGDGPDAASGPALAVVTAADAAHEAQVIAATLRDLHHGDQVDFADMAVVCRSGAVVEEMADMLQRAGVRTSTPRRPRPLREEHVVADLLRILELGASCARGEEPRIDGPEAMALLRGPFGDADTLRLRRIRRELRDGSVAAEDGAESADGADLEDGADSAVLLAHALVADPDIAVPGLRGAEERDRATVPVHRIRRMIHAVAALGTDADALEALWVAWEAAHVADGWQKAVLGEDPLGEKAGERNGERAEADDARAHMLSDRLDAITSVFAAAERLNERQGRIDVLVFVDHVRSRAVAEDTLAPLAEPTGRIAVITPTQLAGSTREVVVLARVQEGGWPNMRLRSTLFGAAELSAVARAQHTGGEVPLSPVALRALGRDQVLADELRLAVSALSRARSRVLVTAIDGGEQVPSVLVDLLREQVRDPWLDVERLQADPGPAPDVRRLVAALRRRILDGPVLDEPEAVRDPTGPRHAAGLLGALREAGAPGTDPGTWYHQDPSGREPLAAPDAPVTLSPSALERANDCPQAFVLERAGATRPPGPAQSVGTAVHRFAQENPAGVPEDEVASAIARVEELLAPLDLQGTWSGRQILERARRSVTVLLEHLRSAPPALGVEVPFVVDLPGVRLRGIMDRIEGEPGALRVVDVKTGRRAKSQGEAEQDLQLGAYQTAIDQDALADLLGEDAGQALNGAHLVYVGTGTSTARIRTQPPPARSEDPAWFTTIATRVAGDLRGESLRAVKNAHCDVCTVRRSCALWPQGATL